MSSLLTYDAVEWADPSEVLVKTFDFVDEVGSDTVEAVGTNTKTTAVDELGASATSTIISSNTLSGTVLSAKISAMTAGKDYLITYAVKKVTSTEILRRRLVVHCRSLGIFA